MQVKHDEGYIKKYWYRDSLHIGQRTGGIYWALILWSIYTCLNGKYTHIRDSSSQIFERMREENRHVAHLLTTVYIREGLRGVTFDGLFIDIHVDIQVTVYGSIVETLVAVNSKTQVFWWSWYRSHKNGRRDVRRTIVNYF